MKRTTITLSDELAVAVEREAHRRRTSVSQVVRDAVAAHIGVSGDGRRSLPFAALGDSGSRSTARDFEEVLASEWSDDRDR